MIHPLLVATDGYLPGATTLSIAVNGYLGGGAVVAIPEYRGGGQRGDVWDLQDLAQERRRQFLMREDEEIFEMILQFIMSEVSE